MKHIRAILLSVFLFSLLLAGCALAPPTQPVIDSNAVFTQAAQTVVAGLTQTAAVPDQNAIQTQVAATVAAEMTRNAPTATATFTETPTATNTPAATFTPTATLPPTSTPTATPNPIPCDAARFVADVTIPDGTVFAPNTRFTKTWRLLNAGTCNWSSQYSLVFVSGEPMGVSTVYSLGSTVRPGQTIDLSADMIAPNRAGNYRSNWMLRNTQGQLFGIGSEFDDAFWAQIKVAQQNTDYVYDFVFSACQAVWSSDTKSNLPCPGSESDDGRIAILDRPALETGKVENEPGLLTVPNDEDDGYIEGVFRGLRIRDDYAFRSGIMCREDSKGCDVIFSVAYRAGGQMVELGAWREVYDGYYNVVEVDLSFLEGQTIDLYLTVEANGNNRNNNAIWWVPHIYEK
jgi:hypothetical protein